MRAIDTSRSAQLIDLRDGLMSLPAIALIATGLAVLFGLALLSGVGRQLLRVPARIALPSRGGLSRVASESHSNH